MLSYASRTGKYGGEHLAIIENKIKILNKHCERTVGKRFFFQVDSDDKNKTIASHGKLSGHLQDLFFVDSFPYKEILSDEIAKSARAVVNKFKEILNELKSSSIKRNGVLKRLSLEFVKEFRQSGLRTTVTPYIHIIGNHLFEFHELNDLRDYNMQGVEKSNDLLSRLYFSSTNPAKNPLLTMLQKLYRMLEMNFQDEKERDAMTTFARTGVYDFVEDLSECESNTDHQNVSGSSEEDSVESESESEEQIDSHITEDEEEHEDEIELEEPPVWAPEKRFYMNRCYVDNLCTTSISSHCDHRCEQENHIPPNIPIYDGHLHLNENISQSQSDLISLQQTPPIREFHLINNNHKPHQWLITNIPTFSSHVHIYSTAGVHPKNIEKKNPNHKNKLVAVGECGLDETSSTTIDQQIFVLEKQIDLAIEFHLPLVLHCRGIHLYRKLYDCLRNRVQDKNIPIHWHCINSNANLHIVDLCLNEFPNSYIGINGSITYGTNTENAFLFKNWLVKRSPFLPSRLILETDYPYLPPRNLYGTYDPSCALVGTAVYLSKIVNNPNQNALSYIHSSNANIVSMYSL
ncbi:unnamed protein product [Rotaria socialis]|uniref:TatD n=4 Tax=Rotaria socialis TaxID=392032 RepID=A0A821N4K5_9BILA|nr:unnamed protein product [Rotaria socialis]